MSQFSKVEGGKRNPEFSITFSEGSERNAISGEKKRAVLKGLKGEEAKEFHGSVRCPKTKDSTKRHNRKRCLLEKANQKLLIPE